MIHCGVRWNMSSWRPGPRARHHLHRRRPRAHDSHSPPVERDVVVPARGVEPRPSKCRGRRSRGAGVVQHTRRRDHHVHGFGMPAAVSTSTSVFEPAARDRLAEPDRLLDVVVGGDPLQIALDLAPGEKRWLQSGVERERIGIQMGRHVTCQPRIAVLVPGSPDPVRLLEHRELVEPGLLQLDGAEDPRHPGPDHSESHARRRYGPGPHPSTTDWRISFHSAMSPQSAGALTGLQRATTSPGSRTT